MAAIIIKSDNARNLKLLTEIAERLGEEVGKINESQIEDITLGILMKKVKTGKDVSRNTIFKALGK